MAAKVSGQGWLGCTKLFDEQKMYRFGLSNGTLPHGPEPCGEA